MLVARPRKNVDTDLIIRMYINDKMSIREIEKKTGYSRSTIHRRLKEKGVKVVKVIF